MYSFLASKVTARIKGPSEYDWLRYTGKAPVRLAYRGNEVVIKTGDVFGVRPATSAKAIRLVLQDEITKVITIDLDSARKLAKSCAPAYDEA